MKVLIASFSSRLLHLVRQTAPARVMAADIQNDRGHCWGTFLYHLVYCCANSCFHWNIKKRKKPELNSHFWCNNRQCPDGHTAEAAATKFNIINLFTKWNPFDRRPVNFESVWYKEFLLGQETMEILSTLNFYEPQQNAGGLAGLHDLSWSGLSLKVILSDLQVGFFFLFLLQY